MLADFGALLAGEKNLVRIIGVFFHKTVVSRMPIRMPAPLSFVHTKFNVLGALLVNSTVVARTPPPAPVSCLPVSAPNRPGSGTFLFWN